jgi:hypothetical protein
MALDQTRIALLGRDVRDFQEAHTTAENELLGRKANLVGVGLGVKWTNGQPTGEPALLALVTHKAGTDDLKPGDRVPPTIVGVKTDVLAVGTPMAGAAVPTGVTLTRRLRPVMGGFSVGHKDITAGTIATAAYDILPGGTMSPPNSGTGNPPQFYILSNNHILANGNAARIGDPILQPGPFDGGVNPDDQIATLSRFIPLDFAPDIPLDLHNNIVDAAVAVTNCSDVDRQLYWIGRLRGWRRKANINVGTIVQKVGRSSGYTIGRITAIRVTIDIGYGGGRGGRLRDQIITTAMSSPGDSGSLIATLDGVAVGLLCAGSPQTTVINQIENVRSQLGIEVAEQIL